MALTTCPDCGKDISTLATSCLNCGRPMKHELVGNAPDIIAEIAEGKRVVCTDGICTGIIGKNGNCRTCGKHYSWKDEEEECWEETTAETQSPQLKCPECASTQITAQKRGFGLGKAAVSGLLLGPVGLLGGFVGSGKIKVTCIYCGHSWSPGDTKERSYVVCLACHSKNRVQDNSCLNCGGPLCK